eukprot:scaffold8678_cov90-Isochrysis_galbana.AAC.2
MAQRKPPHSRHGNLDRMASHELEIVTVHPPAPTEHWPASRPGILGPCLRTHRVPPERYRRGALPNHRRAAVAPGGRPSGATNRS